MNEETKKLYDNARSEATSYALACVRTTVAKRGMEDALSEENLYRTKLDEAMKALALSTSKTLEYQVGVAKSCVDSGEWSEVQFMKHVLQYY